MVRLLRTVVRGGASCDRDQAEDGQKWQFAHRRPSTQMPDQTDIVQPI